MAPLRTGPNLSTVPGVRMKLSGRRAAGPQRASASSDGALVRFCMPLIARVRLSTVLDMRWEL